MSIQDFRRFDDATSLKADVCIIGSGPAGWTLSRELRDSGLSVLVLESGGALESGCGQYDADAEVLNATIDVGQPLFNGRRRTLGGSTEAAGWANRTTSFDPIDYELRDWVPYSGWPIDAAAVAPFLNRAAVHLGIGAPAPNAPRLPRGSKWPPVDPALLAPVTWTFGMGHDRQVMRYAQLFRGETTRNLRVLVHATVTQIITNQAGTQVEAVEIASPNGRRSRVEARAIVVAAGGIENPRILLNSNRLVPAGLGNAYGLVGRFLMDHPRDLGMAVQFDLADTDRLRRMVGPFRMPSGAAPRYVTNGFALSPDRQHRDQLLNTAAWLIEEPAEDDPIDAVKRLVRMQGDWRQDARMILTNTGLLWRSGRNRVVGHHALHRKPRKIGFVIGSEQQPDPDSRVMLDVTVDRFGLANARTSWRINDAERRSQAALARSIESEFIRLGLPNPILAGWVLDGAFGEAPLVDGCHPTATTRMANDPRHGVVDADCQVHGIAGLYVAGSSVFPTAGHANPTLMIAAMTARLADHLARSLLTGTAIDSAPSSGPHTEPAAVLPAPNAAQDAEASWAGITVAVTGATGFLGRRLVEDLIERGARIVCLSRTSVGGRLAELAVETRILDLAEPDVVRAGTTDIDYVVHCAYDWSNEDWNRCALAALIDAGRTNQWQRLVHISSFVVYDLPPAGVINERSLATTAPWGYARVKVELEDMLTAAVSAGDLAATILQPTLIYGPGSQPWTNDPLDKLTNGTVILPDRGKGICNAVFVDDVIQAMRRAARAPAAVGQRYLVSGAPVTWREFYEKLAEIGGVAGPEYVPSDTIIDKNRTVARLVRGLVTPRLLARKIAVIDPVRRAIAKHLPRLPDTMRATIDGRLYGPIARLPGHTHLPDAGELKFLSASATIGSDKARAEIGYAPTFDIAAGMDATRAYVQRVYARR